MKKSLLLIALFAYSCFAQTITWTEITSQYSSLPQGVKLFKGERSSPALQAYYFDVDLNNSKLAVRPYTTSSFATVPSLTKKFGAFAAVNGGFFGASGSYSAVVYPNEVKAQNVPSVTRNNQTYPVVRSFFAINTDRSMSVDWIYHFGGGVSDIYKFDAPLNYANNDPTPLPAPDKTNGTQYSKLLVGIGGGPTLVKNGKVDVTYDQEIMWGSGVGTTPDPRTAVGYTSDKHVIILVADGRIAASAGLSLNELAQVMINLGCVEALNLDGGGSTQMAVGDTYVNNPSTRDLPSILAIVSSDSLNIPKTPVFEKIIDTGDEGAVLEGNGWFASANPGYYGSTKSELNPKGDGSAYALFNPGVSVSASYDVYGWWVASSNRCSDTPFIIKHKYGTDTVRVDQTTDGSQWKLIGSYVFSGDTTDKVIISNAATNGDYIVADAIRLVSYDSSTVTSVNNEFISSTNEFQFKPKLSESF